MTVMFWPVVIFMAISLAIGLYTYTKVRGSSTRFAVCEKSLPFIVVGTALMAQAVDGNSTLGAVSLTYTGSVWAGLMISVGLGLSLFVVGRFLASPLNRMNLLTLPEFFYRRYGKHTELLVSILTIVSFTILIAGNLSAVAWVLSVVSGSGYLPALVVATVVIVTYTIAGGLYSAIWTDFLQVYARAPWLCRRGGLAGDDERLWHMVAAVPASTVDLSSLVNLRERRAGELGGLIALAFGQRDGARLHGAGVCGAGRPHGAPGVLLRRRDDRLIGACVAIVALAAVASVQGLAGSADGAADDGRRVLCPTGLASWSSSACSARRCPRPTAPSSSSRSCSRGTSFSAGAPTIDRGSGCCGCRG